MGIDAPTEWLPFTLYTVRNSVLVNDAWYWCLYEHASGATFDAAEQAYWELLVDWAGQSESAEAAAAAAAASAAAAHTSEINAANSAASVGNQANQAAASAAAAHISEVNAASSAANAKTSETNSKTSETNAKASETNAKASETNAATSALAAAESVCTIQEYWLGAFASPPSQSTCGEAVVAGAMYWDLTLQATKVFDGVLWHDVIQLAPSKLADYLYLPSIPTTVFSGVDHYGKTLALDTVASEIAVYVNGVKLLDTIDYTATASNVTLLLGSVATPSAVEIVSLNKLDPPQVQPAGVKVNTNAWVFTGAAKSFPLKDSNSNALTPASPMDCLVSVNGVMQEPGGDYTVSGSTINFVTAPEADAGKWMVVGLPLGGSLTRQAG